MKPYKLPFSLPPALPMPFDAEPPVAVDLFDKPALPVVRCEPLARIWSKSLRDGVAAAVTHDHALFEQLPGRHDPESLNGIYSPGAFAAMASISSNSSGSANPSTIKNVEVGSSVHPKTDCRSRCMSSVYLASVT